MMMKLIIICIGVRDIRGAPVGDTITHPDHEKCFNRI